MNVYNRAPVSTNTYPTSLDPTEEFKKINKIIEAIIFLADPMSYQTKTVLLQL